MLFRSKKGAAAASQQRAKHFIALAEQEESYRRVKEAMTHYTKATECDPPEGLAWYKIAQILRNHEDDNRGALNNLRKAVAKEPRNVSFRIALAEVYLAEKLAANAQREFMTVLEIDPKNDTAKGMLKQLKR